MIDWAPGQLKKLQEITDRIPAGALHDRAAESTQLVRAAATRANGLKALSGCSCLGSAATDELGPIPCPVCDLPQTPGQPPAPASTAPSSGKRGGNAKTSKSPTGASATPGATSGGGSTAPAGAGSGSGTTSGGIATDPLGSITIQVPTLLPGSSSTSGGATATQSCVLSLLGICIKL
jgi:hypothetical protein